MYSIYIYTLKVHREPYGAFSNNMFLPPPHFTVVENSLPKPAIFKGVTFGSRLTDPFLGSEHMKRLDGTKLPEPGVSWGHQPIPSWGTFFFVWRKSPGKGSHRKIKPKPDTGYFPIGSNGTGMFTYLWLSFMVNVGKIFRYMDPRIESWLLNRDPQNG